MYKYKKAADSSMYLGPLMRALSSEVNLQILSVLRSGSFHPRELARILQKDESDVSRRLKNLERLGLVEGKWVRVEGRNIRVYSLKAEEIRIDFRPGELRVEIGDKAYYKFPIRWETRPEVDLFVGRRKEIETLKNSKGVIVVYGIAGMGKTTLVANAFPEAYWYSMTGMEDFDYLAWQLGLFLNSLEWPDLIDYLRSGGKEEGEVLKLILEGLNVTKGTVAIDDLHRCGDEKVFRMLSYLVPRLRHGRIILTTRVKPNLGMEGVTYLRLKGLEPREAYQLVQLKGKKISPEDFAGIYELTLGHPFAINLLLESPNVWDKGGDNFFDFLFNEIYQKLNEDERMMLSILAIFDESLEYKALKSLYEKKNAFSVLYALLRRGLVERRGEEYSIHELLRGFVRDVANVDEKAYYGAHSDYLARKMSPPDFLRAMKYAIASGDSERVRELVALRIRRMGQVVADFPKAYLRILSPLPDAPAVKLEIGTIYFRKGFFEKAKRLWLEAEGELEGILRLEVESLLTDICVELGDLDCAGEYLGKTEALAEVLDDPYGWLSYHMRRTKYEFYRGNLREALESAFRELKAVRKLGGIEEEPLVLLHIGDIHSELGNHDEAIRYYTSVLDLSRAYGIRFLEYTSYMELTKVYYNLKNYEKAVEYATKALDYFLEIRNYRGAADTLAYRCISRIGMGELEKAELDAKELVRIAHSTNYPLAWAGYIFLGAVEEGRERDGSEYYRIAERHLKDNRWLYEAVLEELGKVFDVLVIRESRERPGKER